MTEVNICVCKADVLDEVGRLTHYAGSKTDGDESSFDRISTKYDDKDMLQQFWRSGCDGITEQLKPFIKTLDTTVDYEATLELSCLYDTSLTPSMVTNLENYLASYIVSRWYLLTNKGDAATYEAEAAGQLTEAMRKVYYKKKPTRKTI